MKTYSLPRDDCSGNFPVWSEYDLLILSCVTRETKTSFVLALEGSWAGAISSEVAIGIAGSMDAGLVDLRPFCCILRCPLLVCSDLGRCLVIRSNDNPGKVVRRLLFTARRSVDATGLNMAPWMNAAKSAFVFWL